MKHVIAYLATALVGLILSYNTNIFQEDIKATEVEKPYVMPPPIQGNFKLNLDLENGKSIVESNLPIASTDITVNHPTKIVEKVVEKPIIKKEVKYETKTEYVTKLVSFTLPIPKLHSSRIEYPKTVEYEK